MAKKTPTRDELRKLIEADRKASMLTPEEIERLREDSKHAMESARQAFAHLRPKAT